MTVKRVIFWTTYPVFALVMQISWVRQFIAKVSPFLAPLVSPYYLRWYSLHVDYSSAGYQLYQSKYWDTVGQWRWAVKIDYSDMIDTLKRYFEERDRSLVELGCGTGAMLGQIRSAFPSLVLIGIDSAVRMCAKAKRLVPTATIMHEAYGPLLKLDSADIVVARSTLTYIDESDISNVLKWVASITKRLFVISDVSAINDERQLCEGTLKIERISKFVYKRLHDHSHVRDYARYPELAGFELAETRLENAQGHGNRQWIFRVPQKIESCE
jgi:SAM-dependent methyltransferase